MGITDFFKNIAGVGKNILDSGVVGFNSWGGSNFATPTKSTTPTITPTASQPVVTSNAYTAPIGPKIDKAPVSNTALNQQPIDIKPAPTGQTTSNYNQYFPEPTPSTKKTDTITSDMESLISKYSEKGDVATKLYEENKIAEKRQQLADIDAKAAARKRQLEDEVEDLRKNPMGQSLGAVNYNVSERTRLANKELADIAIQKQVALGDVNTALQIVNDKVSLQFDPIKEQIDMKKTLFDLYQDDLTDSESKLLDAQIKQEESQLSSQIEEYKLQESSKTYQAMLEAGTIAVKDVPQDVIGYLNMQGYASPEQKTALTTNKTGLDKAFRVLTNPLFGQAVGKLTLADWADFSGKRFDIREDIKSLMSGLTLDNLAKLKGAPSDKDIEVVQSATSKLGNPDNLRRLPQKEIQKEIQNVIDVFANAIIESPASSVEDKIKVRTYQIKLDPVSKGMTDEDITKLVKEELSFNQVGNTSASKITEAIKKVESQGNYNAKGQSGEFGAYQFMPNTWKQWAGEFLGNANAQPTKENQDKVAQAKVNQLLKQGYNAEQIALIWNGGTPQRKKGVNKFGVKYDSGAYADKVIRQLTA